VSESLPPIPGPKSTGGQERSLEQLRAEIRKVEVQILAVADPDVLGALEINLKVLRAQLPQEPEEAAQELRAEPLSPAQIAEAENLIRLSRVEKMRGNAAAATDLLRRATEVAPGSAAVLEGLGDDLMDRKQYREAKIAYGHALKLDPKNVSLERKFGELVLRATPSTMSIEDQLRAGSADSLFSTPSESLANAKVALAMSVMVPGAGQFVLGYTSAGFWFLGTWLVMVGWMVTQQHDMIGVLAMIGVPNKQNITRPDHLVILVPVFAAMLIHVTSIFTVATKIKGREKRVTSRPAPPVDKSFEL